MLRAIRTAGARLDLAQIEAVWQFSQRFVRRERAEFVRKLREAERVILYRRGSRLLGLLAIDALPTRLDGRDALALHIRWAMLDRSIRRRGLLARTLARIWLAARVRQPTRPIFIIFAAATWRSYLAAASAVPCWPRPGEETPAAIQHMATIAMRQVAGDDWEHGILRGKGQWRYQEGLIGDAEQPERDEMRLYARLNPEQAQGDAPLCVIPTGLGVAIQAVWRSVLQRLRPATPRASS